jgi:hypothetical protein
MSTVREALLRRLSARGVPLNHVPGLIRTVCSIVGDGGLFTPYMINQKLERLGWGKEVLDETSFQLIVAVLEGDWGYRVRRFTPR